MADLDIVEDAKTLQEQAQDLSLQPNSASHSVRTEINKQFSIESSFDTFFTRAKDYAYATVVQSLNPFRHWDSSSILLCSSCSENLWRGYPIQERLLRACHAYTVQWLSERDIEWLTEKFPAARFIALKKHGDMSEEPELVRAVGAWSIDLKCDRAKNILLSTSQVDTVPENVRGIFDARLRTISIDKTDNEMLDLASDMSSPQAVCQTHKNKSFSDISPSPQHCVTDIQQFDDQGPLSETGSDTSSESDPSFLDRQVERLLPTVIASIRLRAEEGSGAKCTPVSSFESNENNQHQNLSISFHGQNNRHARDNERKRKRTHVDDEGDDSGNDNNEPVPRMPNPMLLEVTSAKLACHFYMFDRHKYRDGSENGKLYKTCPNGFKDSKELRDHLKKKHCGPKQLCTRCHTSFDDSAQKAVHENSEVRCVPRRNTVYERERYILIGTERRVGFDRMKKPKNVTHEQHWFDTWQVLFPDHPFPTTPYMPHDPFDITWVRIADEEIHEAVRGYGAGIDTNTLRCAMQRLTDRLWQRIREELHVGWSRESAPSAEVATVIEPFEDIETSTMSATNLGIAHDQRTVSHYDRSSQTMVDPFNNTTIPTNAHYSHPGWDNAAFHELNGQDQVPVPQNTPYHNDEIRATIGTPGDVSYFLGPAFDQFAYGSAAGYPNGAFNEDYRGR